MVAAAGNRGASPDAVTRAPGNDPYAITVGGIDDAGTKLLADDALADWSSRGTTQSGLHKPDVLAPGAHLVSTLAPGSDFARECPACVVAGQYIRLGGTSMAAAVASGVVADLLQLHPAWTPDQVKAVLMGTGRVLRGVGGTIDAPAADRRSPAAFRNPNAGLKPNGLVDPATGEIDDTRASWSRASWSTRSMRCGRAGRVRAGAARAPPAPTAPPTRRGPPGAGRRGAPPGTAELPRGPAAGVGSPACPRSSCGSRLPVRRSPST